MNMRNYRLPAVTSALAGGAAFFLRAAFYRNGFDDRGLLVRFHPLAIVFWIVAAAVTVLTAMIVLRIPKKTLAPMEGRIPGLGMVAMGLGVILSLLGLFEEGRPGSLQAILGWIAGACLLWGGILKLSGRKNSFLPNLVFCIFLAFRLIGCYRIWSRNPQMELYLVSMAALVLLMLYSYYQTAGELGMNTNRAQVFTGSLTLFFSLAALADNGNFAIPLGGAIWSFSGLLAVKEEV